MFDLGWQEFMIVGIVLLLVVRPQDLPGVLRTVMSYIKKIRATVGEFQRTVEDAAREVDLDGIKDELNSIAPKDTLNRFKQEISDGFDPTGSIDSTFKEVKSNVEDLQADLKNDTDIEAKNGVDTVNSWITPPPQAEISEKSEDTSNSEITQPDHKKNLEDKTT